MGVLAADVGTIVVIYSIFEGLNTGPVAELNDVSVININVESSLLRKFIKSVIKVFTMLNILFKAENGPLSEVDWLVNDCSENFSVVKGFGALLFGVN